MPFWLVVFVALLGVPFVLFVTGMGMVFAAGGYAGGPQESRAKAVFQGWLAFAWVMAAVFGAFGLAPAWRAWHGGAQDFVGSQRVFVDWLVGVGAVLAVPLVLGRMAAGAARWLLLALGVAPWAAIVAWIVWPLVLWALHGRFDWPDAATGWTHMAEVVIGLLGAIGIEESVRRMRKAGRPGG